MKKISAICLTFLFCFSLAACGQKKENTTTSATVPETTMAAATEPDLVLPNAIYLCQFVKDCQAEPDSFRLHQITHIEETGRHCYYLEYSHQVKNNETERTHQYAEFDGDTLVYIVTERSSMYNLPGTAPEELYGPISALFQEQESVPLDEAFILSNLK